MNPRDEAFARREPVLLTVEDALNYAVQVLEERALTCMILKTVNVVDQRRGLDSMPPDMKAQYQRMKVALRDPELPIEPAQQAARRIRDLLEEERVIQARRAYQARERGGES